VLIVLDDQPDDCLAVGVVAERFDDHVDFAMPEQNCCGQSPVARDDVAVARDARLIADAVVSMLAIKSRKF